MSTFTPPPVIEMTFIVDGEPHQFTYKISKAKFRSPTPETAKTARGMFAETVMDRLHMRIPANYAEANKSHYTPLNELLDGAWFKYFVEGQRVTNAEFDEKYNAENTEFILEHKYGEYAVNAMVSLLNDVKEYMRSEALTFSDIRSMKKVAMNFIEKKDYIYTESLKKTAKAVNNGNSK